MYKVYYTNPVNKVSSGLHTKDLISALTYCESLRNAGYTYVTLVSEHPDMCGKPGAKMSGSEYVPQMLN